MSIHDSTLKSLIAATRLPEEAPLRVPPGPEQLRQLEALKLAILPDSPEAHISKWNDRPTLVMPIRLPVADTYRSYRYSLHLDVAFVDDMLQISPGYRGEGAPLAGAEQLLRLSAALRERMLEQWRKEQKRDKIRKLKERAIETQIEALAARMGFAFALEPMHTKVKLIVRLDKQNGLLVDIPYNRIQDIIGGLERLIVTVRELYSRGVRFKVSGVDARDFREPRPA